MGASRAAGRGPILESEHPPGHAAGRRPPGSAGLSTANVAGGLGARPLALLIIDDDVELCELLQEFFARQGMTLDATHDGRRGLKLAMSGAYDLLLLDGMLPDIDGLEVLRLVRQRSSAPIIMLTARTMQADRVAGLEAGADDYLPKPFGTAELLARIRAVLRRAGGAQRPPEAIGAGGIRLVTSARTAFDGDSPLPLTTAEYDILAHLVSAAGRVVSRDELTVALYQRRSARFDRALDMHISNLRRKLGERASLIATIRGVGFLFRSGGPEPEGPR